MHKEAAYELRGIKIHRLSFISIASVLIGKNNPALMYRFDPLVGYGYAVGITAKIVKYLLRSSKGALGVDDPFLLFNCLHKRRKSGWFCQRGRLAGKNERLLMIGAP